jgi:hypothetical protein
MRIKKIIFTAKTPSRQGRRNMDQNLFLKTFLSLVQKIKEFLFGSEKMVFRFSVRPNIIFLKLFLASSRLGGKQGFSV